jgi:hypothetical protein
MIEENRDKASIRAIHDQKNHGPMALLMVLPQEE